MIYRNARGELRRSGPGGTYPINDGDPQNDDPDFDEEAFELSERQAEYFKLNDLEGR